MTPAAKNKRTLPSTFNFLFCTLDQKGSTDVSREILLQKDSPSHTGSIKHYRHYLLTLCTENKFILYTSDMYRTDRDNK